MDLVGNEKTRNLLDKESKNFFQSYIFSGVAHLGKFSVALDFAQKITGESGDATPDIRKVFPEEEEKKGVLRKKDIGVGEIRQLRHWAQLFPLRGEHKVVIIDEAQMMTVSAQNALLKILEEPPEKCVFILVCHNLGKMLPTIKSRCVLRKFFPLEIAEMKKALVGKFPDKDLFLFSGRPGLALDPGKNQNHQASSACRELEDILGGDVNQRFFQAEKLSKNSSELEEKMNFWIVILRQNTLKKRVLKNISPLKSFSLIEEIEKSLEILRDTNVSKRLVLENLFLSF